MLKKLRQEVGKRCNVNETTCYGMIIWAYAFHFIHQLLIGIDNSAKKKARGLVNDASLG